MIGTLFLLSFIGAVRERKARAAAAPRKIGIAAAKVGNPPEDAATAPS
jgi:hypothetical protein